MANEKKKATFKDLIYDNCGREVGKKIEEQPDNVFKMISLALFSVFFFNRRRYNEFALEIAEAFVNEIQTTLQHLEKQEGALKTLKRFPGWKQRRFTATQKALLHWQKVLPALVGLAKAYAYIGRPWQFITRDSAQFLHLETPEGAAWRMLREYAEAVRLSRIDAKTAKEHGPLIKRVLVDETKLVSVDDFKAVLKWAKKETDTYPTPTTEQVMADEGSDDETADTTMAQAMRAAGVTA